MWMCKEFLMLKDGSKYAGWHRHRRGKLIVATYIEPELKKRLDLKAAQLGQPRSWVIKQAITKYLAKK